MPWNHRVIRRTEDGETAYGIHEVYYRDGKAESFTQDAVAPLSETLDGLQQELRRFERALTLPVLDYDQVIGTLMEPPENP